MKTNRDPATGAQQSARGVLPRRVIAILLWLLLFMALPAALEALEYGYHFDGNAITINRYHCLRDGAVAIPNTINDLPVTAIGDVAFTFCTSLTSVTIPNSVTSIGLSAFSGCTSLTSVTIPSSVTSIGAYAFASCKRLPSIEVAAENPSYSSAEGVLFDKSKTTLKTFPGGKAGSYTIPSSVTSIGGWAFHNCPRLTSIEVAAGNPSYSSAEGVLLDKSKTTLMTFPGGKSGSYTIPNSVTSIAERAFYGCAYLTHVTIPNSVTSIGHSAFSDCTSLTSVTIPNSVTSIGAYMFNSCKALTSIEVAAGNPSYSSAEGVLFDKNKTTLVAFPGGKAGRYTIPNSVTSIGGWAFYNCNSLTSVTFPNNVTSIGYRAFYGCTSLTSVTFPNSVTSIGDTAFYGCTSLTGVTIPNSVTSIGDWAFFRCTSLTNVTIPNSVTGIGGRAFNDCTNLTSIEVAAGNPSYSSAEGVLFDKSKTTLIAFPGGKSGSYMIPNSVTSIAERAFSGCTSLTSVTIPNSVTSIEGWAFGGCANLKAVKFQGYAPSNGTTVFVGADQAIVYFLKENSGFGSSFAGRPAFLELDPQVLTRDASFGIQANGFSFKITGTSGLVIMAEACEDLVNPIWTPVSTNTLTGGTSQFIDTQWKNYPTRLYRLRLP